MKSSLNNQSLTCLHLLEFQRQTSHRAFCRSGSTDKRTVHPFIHLLRNEILIIYFCCPIVTHKKGQGQAESGVWDVSVNIDKTPLQGITGSQLNAADSHEQQFHTLSVCPPLAFSSVALSPFSFLWSPSFPSGHCVLNALKCHAFNSICPLGVKYRRGLNPRLWNSGKTARWMSPAV